MTTSADSIRAPNSALQRPGWARIARPRPLSAGVRRSAERSERVSEQNKRLVRDITAVVWNRRSLDRIPEFYAPDFVAEYRPYAPLREGHAGIREMVERA